MAPSSQELEPPQNPGRFNGDSVTFTPQTGKAEGSYQYTVSDGHGGTASATVKLGFVLPNQAPDAVNDSFTGKPANQPLTIAASDLLKNDTDPDKNPLTVSAVSNPQNGTVALKDGKITFTPTQNATTASFQYQISDGQGGNDTAMVTLGFNAAVTTQTAGLPPDTRTYDLTLPLTENADKLDGSLMNESILGLGGNDTIYGNAGVDHLDGGDGDDSLEGGDGDDYLIGGAGNDTISGQEGIDSISGGKGNDVIYTSYTASSKGTAPLAYGDEGEDTLSGFGELYGGTDNDMLAIYEYGNGGDGNDTLTAEYYIGYRPPKMMILDGGAGADMLSSSYWSVEFRYTQIADSGVGIGNRDIIADFDTTDGSVIDLSRLSNEPLNFISTAPFSGKAAEVNYSLDLSNQWTLVSVDLNGDAKADMEIQLTGVKILVADDFILTPPGP